MFFPMQMMETTVESNKELIINEILKALRYANMSLDWAHKGTVYVCLAYEYYNLGMAQEGNELLIQIPQEYFKKHMSHALSVEKGYLEVTTSLINLMIASENCSEEVVRTLTLVKGNHGNA